MRRLSLLTALVCEAILRCELVGNLELSKKKERFYRTSCVQNK